MMSAQMLSSASSLTGTTADLAPGEKDGMRLLEAKAAEMAGSSGLGSRSGNIMFVRGETQGDKKDKVINPDEIDIGDEEDEEEDEEADVEVPLEKQSIPSEVFGSLKKAGETEEDD